MVLLKKKLRHREDEIAALKRIADQEARKFNIDLASRREEFEQMMPKPTPSVHDYNARMHDRHAAGGASGLHHQRHQQHSGTTSASRSGVQPHLNNNDQDPLSSSRVGGGAAPPESVTSLATSVPSEVHVGFLFNSEMTNNYPGGAGGSHSGGGRNSSTNPSVPISKKLMPSPAMTELERAKMKEERRARRERREQKRMQKLQMQGAAVGHSTQQQGEQDQCATQ